MPNTLRSRMIRLAATMPKGSSGRKALLNVLAGDDFGSMGMPDLEKVVAKSFRGSKHNRRSMSLELTDGTLVLFSRIGGGPGQSKAKTFINVYRAGEDGGPDIPITSVADAVAKIKKAK